MYQQHGCPVDLRERSTAASLVRSEDGSLLFQAGLFSSVLTAFSVSSYTLLQPNPQDRTNALLEQLSYQLSASMVVPEVNTTNIKASITAFSPPPAAVRLNVLWFSSLTCSLLAALIAVLAKQWMVEYPRGAAPSATPCERAQHRQIRFAGITTWHFLAVIDFLPSLITISFVLFFIGLCDFLFSLNAVVGWVVTVLCVLGFLFILFTNITAMVYPSCPFRTPLSSELSRVITATVNSCMTLVFGPVDERNMLWYHPWGWRGFVIKVWKWARHGHPDRAGKVPRWALNTDALAEDPRLDVINAKAVAWLLHWVANEDVVLTVASFLPLLPASNICTPLADALPRLCTLFQSYFTIEGDMDSLCPKIVPKDNQDEKIKILGQAIHRIMLLHPTALPAGRATRVIGDVFGDAYLVFPPRSVRVDTHVLVCCLFITDSSYHRRYSQAVRGQLFVSLLRTEAMSAWALTMVLDSLCSYLSTGSEHLHASHDLKHTVLSYLVQILRRRPLLVELSSTVGLAFKVVLDGILDSGILIRDKAEFLPQNLLLAVSALAHRRLSLPQNLFEKHLVEDGLSTILRAIREFALDKDLGVSFRVIRQDIMALLSQLLCQADSLAETTAASAVAIFDCYPHDPLPFSRGEVKTVLPNVVAQLLTSHADHDIKTTLHMISRLIDIEGEATALPPLEKTDRIGKTLVDVLRDSHANNDVQLAVLQSFASRADFWFRRSGLLENLVSAGINEAMVRLLLSPLPETSLTLVLVITNHLAPTSPLQLLQADPQLAALESILKRRELEPYTRQQAATVILHLLLHLSAEHRTQALNGSEFFTLARDVLKDNVEIEEYVIEDWCEMSRSIAKTHQRELVLSGFLAELQKVAKEYGRKEMVEWIPDDAYQVFYSET